MSLIEGSHPLLESRSPAYTNATVRRAFIVWMHCGQRNSFKDVCNYYHYLETLEDKLPADRRATSRYHEFNMFSTPPPTSPYLEQIFPKLYTLNNIQHYIKNVDAIKNDTAFKLDALTDLKTQNNVTAHEILNTSNMIKKYCKSHMIPLRKFLTEFKEFSRKCELNYTVNNVAFYIKRKMVEEELLMVENYSKCLNFLNMSDEKIDIHDLKKLPSSVFFDATVGPKVNENQMKVLPKTSQKQMTILKRDKKDVIKQYWNDFTSNYVEISRHSFTRT